MATPNRIVGMNISHRLKWILTEPGKGSSAETTGSFAGIGWSWTKFPMTCLSTHIWLQKQTINADHRRMRYSLRQKTLRKMNTIVRISGQSDLCRHTCMFMAEEFTHPSKMVMPRNTRIVKKNR